MAKPIQVIRQLIIRGTNRRDLLVNKPHIILTPDQLCAGPQEITLIHRHLLRPRSVSEFDQRADRYDSLEIGSREIRFQIDLESDHLVATIDIQRVFLFDGSLTRVFRLSPEESRRQQGRALEQHIMPCQVAAWLASQDSGTHLGIINLLYYVGRHGDADPLEIWGVEIPVAPAEMIESFAAMRMELIAEALETDDSSLPECTIDERNGTCSDPFRKCRYCQAAEVCPQLRRHLNAS